MRRLATVVLILVLIPLVLYASPQGDSVKSAFGDWVDHQEQTDTELASRIAELEQRVAALEEAPTTTTTTTVPTTTTTAGTLTPSGPITVTQSNTVIENRHFTGSSGTCLRIEGASNVTVRNSTFTNCHKAVYAVNAANIRVEGITCEANMSGRGRNCVQFDKVNGGYIGHNRSVVVNGATLAEDHISVYQSNGTATNPIYVEHNYLEGGGPSQSGSGIMLGDVGGAYQVARNNVLVNPGQVGIGISGGTNNKVLNNTVITSPFSWTNVGIYVWRYTGSLPCSGHEVSGNRVSWFNSAGSRNSFWNGGNCGPITMVGNDFEYQP